MRTRAEMEAEWDRTLRCRYKATMNYSRALTRGAKEHYLAAFHKWARAADDAWGTLQMFYPRRVRA